MSTPLNLVSLFNRHGSEVTIDGDDLLDAVDIHNFVGDLSRQNREELLSLLLTYTNDAAKIVCKELDHDDLLSHIEESDARRFYRIPDSDD